MVTVVRFVLLRVGSLLTGQYVLVRKVRLVGAVYLVEWLDMVQWLGSWKQVVKMIYWIDWRLYSEV